MLQLKDIMTSDVYTLHATQSLYLARSLMTLKHIRHIPIVNADQEFVGLLTHRDLWLFGNSRGRHSTDILSEFRISGQVKMYALK